MAAAGVLEEFLDAEAWAARRDERHRYRCSACKAAHGGDFFDRAWLCLPCKEQTLRQLRAEASTPSPCFRLPRRKQHDRS